MAEITGTGLSPAAPSQDNNRTITETTPAVTAHQPSSSLLSGDAYKNMLPGQAADAPLPASAQPVSPHVVPHVSDSALAQNWHSPAEDMAQPSYIPTDTHHLL